MAKATFYTEQHDSAKRLVGEQNSSLLQVQQAVTQTLNSSESISNQKATTIQQVQSYSSNIPILLKQSEELQETNLVPQWNCDRSAQSFGAKQRVFSLLQKTTESRYPSKANADIDDSKFSKKEIIIPKSTMDFTKLSSAKIFECAKKAIKLHDQDSFIKFFQSTQDVSHKDGVNRTLLTYALEENFTQAIEKILKKISDTDVGINIIDSNNNIALNYATQFLPLTEKNINFIELIAENTDDINHPESENGDTPLHSLLLWYKFIISEEEKIEEDDLIPTSSVIDSGIMPSQYIFDFISEFIKNYSADIEVENNFRISAKNIFDELKIDIDMICGNVFSETGLMGHDGDTSDSEGF